jgi:L-2-hydroxyglutarate oxidase
LQTIKEGSTLKVIGRSLGGNLLGMSSQVNRANLNKPCSNRLAMEKMSEVDILVVGAGVLGVTIAYWLSSLYDCTIALADTAQVAGAHTTTRNTGVLHRPFYLDPQKKHVFARTSLVSYPMWEELAKAAGLPWTPVGTFNVAVEEHEIRILERYRSWGIQNGMGEEELEILDGKGTKSLEPQVECRAALLSKTDVSVDFGAFTRQLWKLLLSHGVRFLGGSQVSRIRQHHGQIEVGIRKGSSYSSIGCRFLVNAAGGGALDVAHACGLATDYAALNFRGEYWVVDEPFASKVTSNIYRPPRFPQFPFLDPHFVVRADGSRQIGPNAVMVPGPYVYSGFGLTKSQALLERPMAPKAKLILNGAFLALIAGELRSSLSKGAMCERVRRFVPELDVHMLNRRAVFGVRSSVIDASGFVPEALLIKGKNSAHVINYNSPGATGAPAYSAMVVEDLRTSGLLEGIGGKDSRPLIPGWDFNEVTARL